MSRVDPLRVYVSKTSYLVNQHAMHYLITWLPGGENEVTSFIFVGNDYAVSNKKGKHKVYFKFKNKGSYHLVSYQVVSCLYLNYQIARKGCSI